jgi:hypothetical protein
MPISGTMTPVLPSGFSSMSGTPCLANLGAPYAVIALSARTQARAEKSAKTWE